MDTGTHPSNNTIPNSAGGPGSWPGAFGLFKYSKAAVRVNLLTILSLLVLQMAVYVALEMILTEPFVSISQTVVGLFLQAALVLAYLSSVNNKRVSVGEKLSESPQYVVQLLVLQILVSLSVIVGLLLFIVPGLILLTRLFVAEYYLIDKNMSAVEAYKASLAATKGNTGKVWGIIGVNFLMLLIAITIVGFPVALYLLFMYSAATALLYQYFNSSAVPHEGVSQGGAPLTPPDVNTFNQPPQ